MTLEDVRRILEADVISGSHLDDIEIVLGCGADLMSDILARVNVCSVLLTGLTNPQVVRTAEMANIQAICFVRGKRPPEETIELADGSVIPLLTTKLPMFESCGRLYKAGLSGCP
jgi:hypothetical protein